MSNMIQEVNNIEDTIYKQGSKRKINPNNFYYTIQYLYNLTQPPKDFFFDEEVTKKIRSLYWESPKITSSKQYIESILKECEEDILSNQDIINHKDFSFFQTEKDCKEKIEEFTKSIESYRESYVHLDNKLMFDVHAIVVTIEDSIYKRMNNWIKQQRFRHKEKHKQVTLSVKAKKALASLKGKLNAKDYNETIILLDKRTDYES